MSFRIGYEHPSSDEPTLTGKTFRSCATAMRALAEIRRKRVKLAPSAAKHKWAVFEVGKDWIATVRYCRVGRRRKR